MLNALLASLYFVLLFGVFEVFMFKRGGAYWRKPLTTACYFLAATVGALIIFSDAPLQLILKTSVYGVVALLFLYSVLVALALQGWFTFSGDAVNKDTEKRKESFFYIFAKSTDILFQDVLAVIVLLSLQTFFANTNLTLAVFSAYFFITHLFLFFILPARFVSIFAIASLFAGIAFASILLYGFDVVYIFVLHWAFYAAAYPFIRKERKKIWEKVIQ
jgi:hypothetical protein